MLRFSPDHVGSDCLWLFICPCLATVCLSEKVGQISLWSVSTVTVLDMLVSLTDGGCPLYSCTSMLIHSHPWMSSPAGNPRSAPRQRLKSRQFSLKIIESCVFPRVSISVSAGGGVGGIGRNKVGNSFIWLVHDGVWMPAWPLPVCDSWHMAALYLHQPESTPQTSAILAVHQGSKLAVVIRTDSWWGKQRKSCLTPWFLTDLARARRSRRAR